MAALRVILHCDLDCFYAQVERERLGLPQDASIAVVQWSMALAVSYPARKYGISRGSSVNDIRKAAGDKVTIVPVETIGGGRAESKMNTEHPDMVNLRFSDVQATEKVSLERYRNASSKVFVAIAEVLSGYDATLERASIDEAYIDVTVEVDRRLRNKTEDKRLPADTMIVGDKLDLSTETDLRLAHGANIAKELRHRVFLKCNYTVSAGISFNKLLAKFASAKNKPNKQTILPLSAVPELMKNVPLRKLRGLGGKLGKQIEELGVYTAGEATKLDMDTLEQKLGKRKIADFVYKCVRGLDETEVVEREATKSLLAAKNFKDENSLVTVEKQWLPLLAEELNTRIIADSEANSRDARTLTVSFRAKMRNGQGRVNASRSTAMPHIGNLKRTRAIVTAALVVLQNAFYKEDQFAFPISFIGLTATNFSDRATQSESIRSYFAIAEQKSGKSHNIDSTKRTLSSTERAEDYRKRVQERADRELALKLHREESSRGRRKPTSQSSNRAIKGPASKRRKRSTDVTTVDMFFKPKNRQT